MILSLWIPETSHLGQIGGFGLLASWKSSVNSWSQAVDAATKELLADVPAYQTIDKAFTCVQGLLQKLEATDAEAAHELRPSTEPVIRKAMIKSTEAYLMETLLAIPALNGRIG